eukprot:gene4439-biopygen22148
MTPRKVATPGSNAAAVQPTTSVVNTNPEGIASSDTEPDSELMATKDGSASVGERPVGTLQPLVAGLAGLTAAPTHGTSSALPRPTPPTQTAQPLNLEERSAAYESDVQRKRRQHMGDHLIAAERIGQLQAELTQTAAAASTMADTFATAVATKDARILSLEQELSASVTAVDAATTNGCTADERRVLVELHFQLGRDLERCRKELRTITPEHGQSLADGQTAMSTLQTALDAAERDLLRSHSEVVRLTEINAELTRQNTDFGKRPVAGPALTAADVMAMITASPRTEAPSEPMETDGGPRGSTSADLYQGCGNGRVVGQKHTLPQGFRHDDPTPTEPISARQLALMKARKALAAPSYAKAAKKERMLYFHSEDHPIAPYVDAQLAKHLTEYADELLSSRDDADLAAAQQVIEDLRDHLTRLFRSNQLRRKANWMDDMPGCIDDIDNRNEALKGTKALATHCPAAPANDRKLNEKLPCPADRQPVALSAAITPDDPVTVSDYVSSDDETANHPGSPRQATPVKPTTDRAPQAGAPTEPPATPATTLPAIPPTEPTAPVRPRTKRAAKLPPDTPSPTRHARADTPRTPDTPTCWPDSIPQPAPHHTDRDHGFAKRITEAAFTEAAATTRSSMDVLCVELATKESELEAAKGDLA